MVWFPDLAKHWIGVRTEFANVGQGVGAHIWPM